MVSHVEAEALSYHFEIRDPSSVDLTLQHVAGPILGHRNQTTTARYAHLSDDPLRLAAGRISGEIAASLNGRPAAEVSHFPKL